MHETKKISQRQIIYLLIITIASTALLFLPSLIYEEAKQDGWLSIVLMTIYGIAVAYIITSLGIVFKDKTIIQYSEIIAGRVLGKLLGLAYIIYFIHINSLTVREFGDFMTLFYMETPVLFFVLALIIASAYAVYHGLEIFTRINEVYFYIFISIIIAIIVLNFMDMDFKQLTPVLADGLMPVAKAAYHQIFWFSEIIVIAMLIPSLRSTQTVRRATIISIVLIGTLALFLFIGIVAIFGAQTSRYIYPLFMFVRYISVADFIERTDTFFFITWVSNALIKTTLLYYCTVLAISQWLGLKDYKPLIIPIGLVLIYLPFFLWSNISEVLEQLSTMLFFPYSIIQAGVPLILLIVAKFKNRGKKI